MVSAQQADFTVERAVRIHAALAPKLNLACYQNSLPVLRELAIINDGSEPLQEVTLTLCSEPAFLKPKIWHIDVIGAELHYHLTELDVNLEGALFGRLSEAQTAQAVFVLNVGGKEVARLDLPIELLARNQWGGVGHMPEMVASFVQPNDPVIDRLLKKAADILRRHGKNGALNGYEGGPKRAWELVSAIWSAVGAMGIDYALPPASFEYAGQKVRGPSQISDSGLATCLDTSLLFCAALEQCGLNPLLVFTHGHACAGVWLRAEEFSTAVVDDVTALRKRIKLNELMLFETTLVTQRPCPEFSRSAELGAQRISETKDHDFELAVDIRRARLQRIKPLASTEALAPAAPVTQEGLTPGFPEFEEAPDLPDDDESGYSDAVEPIKPENRPEDRLDRWQRKLLDLSLRNSLLNFRATKKAIKLDAPDPKRLEDVLAAEGSVLKLLPRPDLMEGADPRSQAIHEARAFEDVRCAHALDALTRFEVFVSLPRDELETRLVDLYRYARSTLQEGGANTLFLALGFLSWTRDDKDDKRHRAPLILIPVTLHRKSVRSGFSLTLHDDEPRFNPTLLEMLRQDYKIAIPAVAGDLPQDDSGLDVARIWKDVARAVKDIKGWEVVDEVVLATFSFAKHLMWKDLIERTEQLKQNPVVRHLIETPRDTYPGSIPFPDPRTLDAIYAPEQTFCPLPVDSSQLSAVMAAAKGKDFVLIGPPGTGKSQTIANLIAQCLAEHKSVLFVSEKIAALDVVYRRLRDVGLGDFCLELHSNKARKLDVLNQLRGAWEATGAVDSEEWRKEAQRLKTLRDQLNQFVEQMHRKHRNGLSAYGAIGRVVAGREFPVLGLSWHAADAHDEDALDALRELADHLDVVAFEVGDIANCPLGLIAHNDWSPNWQRSVIETARELIPQAENLEKAAIAYCRAGGLPQPGFDRRVRDGLLALAKALPMAAGHDWRFMLRSDARKYGDGLRKGFGLVIRHRELIGQLSKPYPGGVIQELKRGLDLLSRHRDITRQLSVPYRAEVSRLDALELQADWAKAERSLWPVSWLRRRKVNAVLSAVVDGQHEPDVASDIERLVALQKLESEINTLSFPSGDIQWAGLATCTENVAAVLAFQSALSSTLVGEPWQAEGLDAVADGFCGADMAADLERLMELRSLEKKIAGLEHLPAKTDGLWEGRRSQLDNIEQALKFQELFSTAIAALATTPKTIATLKAALEKLLGDGNALLEAGGAVALGGNGFCEALEPFQQSAERFTGLIGLAGDDLAATDTPAAMAAACRNILPLEPKLNAWCAWRKVCGEAQALGLAPLVKGIEKGAVALSQVRETFEVDYCRWWINAAVDGDVILRTFVSAVHEKRINDFKALEDRFTGLTRAYVRASLCANPPNQDSVARNSEWGILRHELQKKKRHMPLRELMIRLPNTIAKLTPCLLMSPLSIAQYLTAETAIFDLVVFDEASQIPVWDAVGAIARGKQVVMVGDPKQLPPTNFFDRAESEADSEDVEGDLESILDECLGANLQTLTLSWHYRSRHESLIAFSNHRYYDGSLLTFPSPLTKDKAVSFHPVKGGVYEKGGARINKPEACALVADLVARLKNPDFKASRFTIGVVTFNTEQQRLIEDMLDEERRKSPSIEPYFAENALEPVFVKNLESVQGDERDIMYFSITYGPDAAGAVSMNFGPMNREGGERRLNVAITRARQELRIFSSLEPEQMDLSRTQAAGVRDLKHFLEFAGHGAKSLAEVTLSSAGKHDSLFEKSVRDALAEKGWQIHPQVGVSSLRIDLGVVDPDEPGRYLAGIKCDGASYQRCATARDRDKLSEQILRGLGWEILRVWSADWWINAPDALKKTHARLEALRDAGRARRAEEARKAASVANEQENEAFAGKPNAGFPALEAPAVNLSAMDNGTQGRDAKPASDATEQPAVFRESDPASAVSTLNADCFFEQTYDTTLQAMIAHVIEIEGPVREDVLAKRIAQAHGWTRAGIRIHKRVQAASRSFYPTTIDEAGLFLWPTGSDISRCPAFRRPAEGCSRPMDEIALPELIALALELRKQDLEGEAAIQTMAREAGHRKLRAANRERIELAWREAVAE